MVMARATFQLPEEYLLKISKLAGRTDEIVPKVLEAGGEVVLAKVESNLGAVIGTNTKQTSRSTGELQRSLGLSPAKLDRDGNHNVKIGFSERRPDGKTNALIANTIEYGRSGQKAKPFLKPAKSQSKAACIAAMVDEYEREVEGT
jgi:HK97 gp10 family phage protein